LVSSGSFFSAAVTLVSLSLSVPSFWNSMPMSLSVPNAV
jgi:hypothetical protein